MEPKDDRSIRKPWKIIEIGLASTLSNLPASGQSIAKELIMQINRK